MGVEAPFVRGIEATCGAQWDDRALDECSVVAQSGPWLALGVICELLVDSRDVCGCSGIRDVRAELIEVLRIVCRVPVKLLPGS